MEEEINNRKVPGFALSTFLFFFFYLLIRSIWSDIPSYYTALDAAIAEDEPIIITLILEVLNIVVVCLSFWSVIRILKGMRDGVTCMKWALFFSLVDAVYELLFKSLGKAITINWLLALPSVFHIVFTVIFLTYLSRSKTVRIMYPLSWRKFSSGGWVWLLSLFMYLGLFTYFVLEQISLSQRTEEINVTSLSLTGDSQCDGRILFKSTSDWEKTERTFEDADQEEYDVTYWKTTNDTLYSAVWSGISQKARHFDFITLLMQSQIASDSLLVREMSACDTIIQKNQYYMSQYLYEVDSVPGIWTFGVRYDSESNKYSALSRYMKNGNAGREKGISLSFLKEIIFDLTPYKKE